MGYEPDENSRLPGLFAYSHLTAATEREEASQPLLPEMTAMDIPVIRKYSKTADWFTSEYSLDNIEELQKGVKEHFGVELTQDEIDYIKAEAEKSSYGFGNGLGRVLSNKAQIGWTTFDHTAASVPVFAFGPGAERFTGLYDNTDLPRKIAELTRYSMSAPISTVPME